MSQSVKYISIYKGQYLLQAFQKCNQVPKKLQMHFLVWCRCSGSPSSLPKQFPWVPRQPKQFAWAVYVRAQATQAVCPLYFCLGQFALRISMWTVCSQDFHSRQFTLGISACNSLPLGFLLRTVCPWEFYLRQFALRISTRNSLPLGFLLATVCPWDFHSEQFALGISAWDSLPLEFSVGKVCPWDFCLGNLSSLPKN